MAITAGGRNEKEALRADLISKLELENSRQAMTNMQLEAERIRHWIAEDDVALSLAENARAEIGALRRLAPDGYVPQSVAYPIALRFGDLRIVPY